MKTSTEHALAKVPEVTLGFWLHLQADWDLYAARRQLAGKPLRPDTALCA